MFIFSHIYLDRWSNMIQITKNVETRSKLHHESLDDKNPGILMFLQLWTWNRTCFYIYVAHCVSNKKSFMMRLYQSDIFLTGSGAVDIPSSFFVCLKKRWKKTKALFKVRISQVHSTGFVTCLHLLCQAARAWWGTLKRLLETISDEYMSTCETKMLICLTLFFIIHRKVVEVSTWLIYNCRFTVTSFSCSPHPNKSHVALTVGPL